MHEGLPSAAGLGLSYTNGKLLLGYDHSLDTCQFWCRSGHLFILLVVWHTAAKACSGPGRDLRTCLRAVMFLHSQKSMLHVPAQHSLWYRVGAHHALKAGMTRLPEFDHECALQDVALPPHRCRAVRQKVFASGS